MLGEARLTHARGAIVMAVFRPRRALLEAQIASVRGQTLEGWRCLVGIDGADARARTLVEELTAGDQRFHIREYDENVGVYRNFERLLAEMDELGDAVAWVALADQDDRWDPDKLARLVAVLGVEGVAAVTGQARVVDESGVLQGMTHRHPGGPLETVLHNQVTGSLTVLRREVVDRALPFPPVTAIAVHDHWLGVCAVALGRVVALDAAVQDYVQHSDNVLGEARPARVRAEASRFVRDPGGYLRRAVRDQWGWRVGMARTAVQRGLVGEDGTGLTAVAEGRLGRPGFASLASSTARGRIRVRDAAAMSLAATLWRWWR